jgi:L-aspartate oxidase
VHGANRLASNSLLEGLVFGDRVVRGLLGEDSSAGDSGVFATSIAVAFEGVDPGVRRDDTKQNLATVDEIKRLAWEDLGLVRNEHGLRVATKQLALWSSTSPEPQTIADWQRTNLVTVSQLIATAAAKRKESRGAHFRTDFPHTDTSRARHVVLRRQP